MLLISGSFYFYAQLNKRIIQNQNRETARMLVSPIVVEKHLRVPTLKPRELNSLQEMANSLKPQELQEEGSWSLIGPDPAQSEPASRPIDETDYDALYAIKRGESEFSRYNTEDDRRVYRYYTAVTASGTCYQCHRKLVPDLAEGDLLGMVKITLPLKKTDSKLAKNNAILMAMAIVTSFFAMVAAYTIVRYVIVKPVQHLKDISDQIARGNLSLRANIQTGDEFEELSHAFNRMLRHLVNVQEELQEANSTLDSKVDELAQANFSLFESNKVKNEFLATVSHELRTPLNSILGFSDVLQQAENMNEKQKRYLANIVTSGQGLLNLINDMLDLARIESGRMNVRVTEFDVEQVIQRIVQSMAPIAQKKNIELLPDCEDGLPPVLLDEGKYLQILNNLVSNALKFTPEGGQVRVIARRIDDSTFATAVEDTGIGIPLEDQERIFLKFRQGRIVTEDDNLTRKYEGTGLGLSIVKELCRLLGGEITLRSEFGKGSTFTVNLPLRLDQAEFADEEHVHFQTIEQARQRLKTQSTSSLFEVDQSSAGFPTGSVSSKQMPLGKAE